MNDSKLPTKLLELRYKKISEGLMDYLKRVWEKPGDPEFNFLRPDYVTTKEFDDFLEKVFEPPECCAHGCDYKDVELPGGEWIFSQCRRCKRSCYILKESLKMWRVKDEKS